MFRTVVIANPSKRDEHPAHRRDNRIKNPIEKAMDCKSIEARRTSCISGVREEHPAHRGGLARWFYALARSLETIAMSLYALAMFLETLASSFYALARFLETVARSLYALAMSLETLARSFYALASSFYALGDTFFDRVLAGDKWLLL